MFCITDDSSAMNDKFFLNRDMDSPPCLDVSRHVILEEANEDMYLPISDSGASSSAAENHSGTSSPSASTNSVSTQTEKPAFLLPVDGENKSTLFRPYSIRGVHMQAFHASWLSFFASFLVTFAPAALLPVLRDDLGLSDGSIGHAGVASVAGAVFGRIVMGTVCDTIGPRFGHASLMLLTAPPMLCMALITGPAGFIAIRFIVGLSLASFVACQFWSSVMFNVRIVGIANATGAGFGSSGGGVTLLVMPMLHSVFEKYFEGFLAWRIAIFVPALLCVIVGTMILACTQDLPDGNYAALKKSGKFSSQGKIGFIVAMRNYRTWCLAAVYALSFGCELSMTNLLTSYYFDNFGLSFKTAGILGCLFGLMNSVARPVGGILSDRLAMIFGMPARLWTLWVLHACGGILCIFLGFLHRSLIATVAVVITMAFMIESSEAAVFAVVPFVSKRALGVVAGLVGAGGNAGAMALQGVFFSGSMSIPDGMKYTGISMLLGMFIIPIIYFPMWGGMLRSPREGMVEEDYYLAEYSREEIDQGKAVNSLKFAAESRSQRGSRNTDRSYNGLRWPLLNNHV